MLGNFGDRPPAAGRAGKARGNRGATVAPSGQPLHGLPTRHAPCESHLPPKRCLGGHCPAAGPALAPSGSAQQVGAELAGWFVVILGLVGLAGEKRMKGIGFLECRVVVIVYAEPDDETIRIISVRKADNHEKNRFIKAI